MPIHWLTIASSLPLSPSLRSRSQLHTHPPRRRRLLRSRETEREAPLALWRQGRFRAGLLALQRSAGTRVHCGARLGRDVVRQVELADHGGDIGRPVRPGESAGVEVHGVYEERGGEVEVEGVCECQNGQRLTGWLPGDEVVLSEFGTRGGKSGFHTEEIFFFSGWG